MKRILHFFLLVFFYFSPSFSQSLDDLGITVSGADRQFVFTNKEAGTFHGNVSGPNTGGWQGWFVNAERILNDYTLSVNDTVLDRSTARSTVYPHQLIRRYPNGIRETVTLLDSVDVIVIEVTSADVSITVQPTENFRIDSSIRAPQMHWKRTNAAAPFVPTDLFLVRSLQRSSSVFAIAAGRKMEPLRTLARSAAIDPPFFTARRSARMQAVLDRSPVSFDDRELTVALAWAKLQLDALIMNQYTGGAKTKGIFAGLPWFNNYWGRDSFISLPGATYVIGNFTDARDILRSYAAFQSLDSSDTNYGRIPNLATPQSVIYNTADGTPWFVRALAEYLRYSGDDTFAEQMYPVVVRSIEGTLRHHCDSLGFLTHSDAESWMDAVGPNGPWSPRGDRANDVQALWYEQLTLGAAMADDAGDTLLAARWTGIAEKLRSNFAAAFIDPATGTIADHLLRDGTRLPELRPNQLFTLEMPMPESVRKNAVRSVLQQLVYEHGTATLAQDDVNFHPYHEAPPYYVKDAAYHNGTVWTWLNGIVVKSAVRYGLQDVVFPMTMNNAEQMLRRGTVGALSELLDAHPRTAGADPKLSGTYSQAWSLAEFIRSIYQDYGGVTVDAEMGTIQIAPRLPSSINSASFVQRVGPGAVKVTIVRRKGSITTTVVPMQLTESYTLTYHWMDRNGAAVRATELLHPNTTLVIDHSMSYLSVLNGKVKQHFEPRDTVHFTKAPADQQLFAGLTLARPDLKRSFPVLRGPTHPLLPHSIALAKNAAAALLAEGSDPIGDDTGATRRYTYPTGAQYKKGMFDITGASFRSDSAMLYCRLTFSALTDPGWHPEYGFQLTMAAIAVNTGSGRQRTIPANAGFELDAARVYDRLILVGGGVRVLNDSGTILCEYIPQPEDLPATLGNARTGVIEFAVPLSFVGAPSPSWKFTILAGAQDDHGGAGIGEFRTVQADAGEWNGGGRRSANDSNVYDVLLIH